MTTANKTTATAILTYLGGNQFTTMTGASVWTYDDNSVTLKLTRNKTQANRLTITLNGKDLFDVKYWYVATSKKTFEVTRKDIKEVNDLYFDMLRGEYEKTTGQATSLTHRYDR